MTATNTTRRELGKARAEELARQAGWAECEAGYPSSRGTSDRLFFSIYEAARSDCGPCGYCTVTFDADNNIVKATLAHVE